MYRVFNKSVPDTTKAPDDVPRPALGFIKEYTLTKVTPPMVAYAGKLVSTRLIPIQLETYMLSQARFLLSNASRWDKQDSTFDQDRFFSNICSLLTNNNNEWGQEKLKQLTK
jgi:hypothetical protein